jgi:hypothetical protein
LIPFAKKYNLTNVIKNHFKMDIWFALALAFPNIIYTYRRYNLI